MDSGSDMDVFEDAVEDHSASHAGVIAVISPIPPNQPPPADANLIPVSIGSPSTSQRMVSLSGLYKHRKY